jgi:hypothetical protein
VVRSAATHEELHEVGISLRVRVETRVIVSQDEIVKITGKERPSAQARWLSKHGWRFVRNALGLVVPHEREAERHLCGGRAARERPAEEPDLEALNG